MKRESKFLAGLLCSALLLTSATQIFAQQPNVVFQRERVIHGPDGMQEPQPFPAPGNTFVYVASEMNFDGKLVKGAPYSAQAITEMTQTLGDGNRIINKSTTSVYRDSEGRTRREHTLNAIGPFPNGGEPHLTISISDPVAGVNYALDPRTKVAHKMSPMRFEFKVDGPGGEARGGAMPGGAATSATAGALTMGSERQTQVFMRTPGGATAGTAAVGLGGFVMEFHGDQTKEGKAESLGKQSIEGVDAEGTRTTLTIPAGAMGNERPIEIISERWYSPELQVVVMTRHSDPRFGENTYRLTNINRSEPDPSLFRVPADYTINEQQPFMRSGGGGVGAGPGGAAGAGAGGKMINGGVLNGKAISLPNPEYPVIARQAKASGTVTVQIMIDEEGNVISAQATSGHPLLQAAGVAAARQAKFSPTKLSGQPVKIEGTVVYNFIAQDE